MTKPEWYSPDAISSPPTISQLIWLIPHLQMLREGVYPSQHKESGYTGNPRRKRIKPKAPFEKACQVHAEIDKLLESQGVDGIILEYIYTVPQNYYDNVEHVARALRVDRGVVFERMRHTMGKITREDKQPPPKPSGNVGGLHLQLQEFALDKGEEKV